VYWARREERTMRLTVLVNGGDPQARDEYAVLWLDVDERIWSRESHSGIELPSWGKLQTDEDSVLLCGPEENAPLCTLHGMSFGRGARAAIQQGAAAWVSTRTGAPSTGHWHMQAVDRQVEPAEHSEFKT
jgi:Protein of unknown function (DUF3564)